MSGEALAISPTALGVPRVVTVGDVAIPKQAELGEALEPTIRTARPEDVEALAQVELSAYQNIYGESPSAEVVSEIETKYRERVELLSDYIYVLETPRDGLYGMVIWPPTSLTGEDFAAGTLDMTDNATIENAYDPEGKNCYVVNLAIRADKQGAGESKKLFDAAIAHATEMGISRVYFESRLPGLQKWIEKKRAMGVDEPIEALATQYWQTTRYARSREAHLPIDPLLRLYVNIGARPLELIKDAWSRDTASQGYGVLCELDIPPRPLPRSDEREPLAAASECLDVTHGAGALTIKEAAAVVPAELDEQKIGFWNKVLGWTNRRKTALLLGSAVAGVAVNVAAGGGQEIVDNVKEHAPWVIGAWAASMNVYFSGAIAMLASAGSSVFGDNKSKKLHSFEDQQRNMLMELGFSANTVGAVSAAGVGAAGMVETLPPSAWGALVLPAADLYSTVVLRRWVHGKFVRSPGITS